MNTIKNVLEVIGLTIMAVGLVAAVALGLFGAFVAATWGRKE